eukprot:TRINITY_DN37854_c0_g2_i1.p1 TRINITY_DN37854_c0_g2~~TRINITY_DN37854_c0_g2_i1.p1  ORF type:complete len:278 (+),score=46.13 TRINITY_DN37854_c0_g2_i1:267-1100(+)
MVDNKRTRSELGDDAEPPRAWLEAFTKIIDSSLESKLTSVTAAVNKVQQDTTELKTNFSNIEKRVAALQLKEDAASIAAVSTRSNASGVVEHEWTAKNIEVRGWSTWQQRDTQGLTRQEALALYAELKNSLAEDLQQAIKEPIIGAGKILSFLVPAEHDKMHAVTMHWKQFFADEEDLVHTKTFVRRELHPHRRAANSLFGRVLRFIENTARAKQCTVDAFWHPDWSVYAASSENQPTLIANLNKNEMTKVIWSVDACNFFGMRNNTDLDYRFRKHK